MKESCQEWMKKSAKKDVEDKRVAHLRMETREFEAKTKATEKIGFWWMDTSWWRLDLRKIPKGFTLSFVVMLRKPLPKDLVDKKLEEAFGKLNQRR